MGNIYEKSVPEIFEDTNTNIIYQYLKHKPLHEIHEVLSAKFDLKKGFRHKCEVCDELFGKEEHVAYLEEVAQTTLGGLLNPGSKPGSTRFFHDDNPAAKPPVAEPIVAEPIVAMDQICSLDQPGPATSNQKTQNSIPRIYNPQGMGFRLSYKCVIGCRHCYQALPGSDVFIDKKRLLGVLEEGRGAGMRNVGFSGGEPFLCADTVIKGIKLARKLGYDGSMGVVTNGFWGKTPKSARKVISKLAEAGLTQPLGRMNLSVGEFHQEWISFSTIGNVVSAFWEQFNQPIYLLVTFSKGNGGIYHKLCDHFAKRGIPEKAYTSQIFPGIAHLGRGNEELAGHSNPAIPIANYKKCVGINRFSIEPTGKVAPCCGFNRFINGLCMGNVYEKSVPEIVEDTNTNIIYQYLKHKPLHEIHQVLSAKFDLKSGFRHKCEVCEELFGKEERVAYLEGVARTALGGLLHPDSRPGSTRFFHDDKPAAKPIVAKPIVAKPGPKKRINGGGKAAPIISLKTSDTQTKADDQNRGKDMQTVNAKPNTVTLKPVGDNAETIIDLSKLSITTLNRLIADATRVRNTKKTEERDFRIRQIRQLAQEYEIDLRDLCAAPPEKTKAATPEPVKAEAAPASAPAKPKEIAPRKPPAKPRKASTARKASAKPKAKSRAASTPRKASAKPKYANPDDSSMTWNGRGKTPVWAVLFKENDSLNEILIKP